MRRLLSSALVGAAWAVFWLYALRALGVRMAAAGYVINGVVGMAAYLFGVRLRDRMKLVGEEAWSAWMLAAEHTEYKRMWKVPRVKLWILYGRRDDETQTRALAG